MPDAERKISRASPTSRRASMARNRFSAEVAPNHHGFQLGQIGGVARLKGEDIRRVTDRQGVVAVKRLDLLGAEGLRCRTPRLTKCFSFSIACAGQAMPPVQRRAASPGSRIAAGHSGQVSGKIYGCSAPVRRPRRHPESSGSRRRRGGLHPVADADIGITDPLARAVQTGDVITHCAASRWRR